LYFRHTKRKQFYRSAATRQGLIYRITDFKLLTADQDKTAFLPVFINHGLHIGNKIRYSLNLIENSTIRVLSQKSPWIINGKLTSIR
jgi:hypothetical protein